MASLSHNRDYKVFLAGQFVSYVGDATALIALPLLVMEVTGSVKQMGLVTTALGAGQLVAGVASGSIADRFDRRGIMIACDIARMVAHAAVPLAWWLGVGSLPLLYVVAFASGALGTCFLITQLVAMPDLVDREHLTAANGRLIAGYGVALFLGPLIAGALSEAAGAARTLGLNALTFAASWLSLMVIRFRPARGDDGFPGDTGDTGGADGGDPRAGLGSDLALGFRFLWAEPRLRAVALLMTVTVVLLAGGNDLFIFHIKANMGHGDRAVGAVFGAAAVGAILGGALASVLRRRMGFGVCFLGALLLQGLSFLALGVVDTVHAFALGAVVFAFANSGSRVYAMTLRQEITPPRLLGRVTAAFWLLTTALAPVGAAGAAALAEHHDVAPVLLGLGAGAIVAAGVGALSPARQRRPEAAGPDARPHDQRDSAPDR